MTKAGRTLKPMELIEFNLYKRVNLLYQLLRFPRLFNAAMYVLRPFLEPRETFINKTWRYGAQTFGMGIEPIDDLKAYRYGAKAILEYFQNALEAQKEGKPVVWVEWILNAEICEAFDVVSFNPETLNIFGNTKGGKYPPMLIEAAEAQGTPLENCSSQKLAIGSYVLDQIPHPDFIIGATHPCDTSISVYQTLEYLTGARSFVYDCPYWEDEGSFEYFTKQTWELIRTMEKHYGKKCDWDKLKAQCERTNKINFYLQEISEMGRAVPCPVSMIDLLYAWVIREINIRNDDVVEMARLLYESAKKRLEKGQGVVKKENVRAVLWFPPMAFFTYLFKWMEHDFGAVIVADFIGHVSTVQIDTSSEESMVAGLARESMNLAMGRQCRGPIELFTHDLYHFIENYSPDCMIFSGHNGCKHGWSAVKIVKDICRQHNLPTLYLSLDIMDQRHLNELGIRREITDFFRSNGWA